MTKAARSRISELSRTARGRWILAGCAVYLLLSLIFFYSFIYNDIIETMRMGIDVWYSLFDGQLNYFYARRTPVDAIAYPKTVQGVYDFPIYIVFALWNFPLWIAENFFDVDVFRSPLCLMWGKTLLLLASVLIMGALYQLCRTLEVDEKNSLFAVILFLTSNFFMSSIIMMSAYDIVVLYFAILGIDHYFRGDMKKFTVCFMCAIPLKFFALLIFIPLVLLREKRIWKIAAYLVASVLPILVFRFFIPCRAVFDDPSSAALSITNIFRSTELSNLAFLYTLTYEWTTSLSRIYLSLAFWGVLYLICYFYKPGSEEKIKKWGIYICFLTFANLFVTCMTHPYWIMLLVPFTVILMAMNSQYGYVNLVLETVMTWGMLLAQMFKFSWCFGSAIVAGMFWPSILGKKEEFIGYTVLNVLKRLDMEGAQGYLIGAGCTAFFGCLLLFAAVNFPGWKKPLPVINRGEEPAWWLMGIRIVAGFALALVPIGLYVIGLGL